MTSAVSTSAAGLTAIVDQYIELMLAIVDEIEQQGEPEAPRVRQQLLQFMRAADLSARQPAAWERARYALIAWTDEVLLSAPWAGRSWWNDHLLEVECNGSRVAGEQFYQYARQAAEGAQLEVLRVYYLCVLLGFRGVYAHHESTAMTAYGLPETLDQWLAETRERLNTDDALLLPLAIQRQIPGAEPFDLRRRIVWWSIAAIGLLMINLTAYRLVQ